MQWALIIDGVVREISGLDPAGRYHESLVWVACDAEVRDGWTCDQAGFAPPAPAEVIASPAFTHKSDVFDRCQDDAEAETILAGIRAMGVKLDAFFHAVDTIQHDHALFAQLKAGFVAAFGAERADELLAPSI
ncbi:hypothetical protein [Microvirga roseola]|uniref:hypothetical protein n=1 Tax=Microvirga roseola TaxID=2883126 RepID=UPI001E4CA8C8|nr:hypothetical protein [Microvirga roseola]